MAMRPATANEIADPDWISRLRAGRAEAVAALRTRLRRGLGTAFSGRADVSDADLDDFSQESVMRVLEKLDTFRGDSSFSTWAMAVAIRVSLTALRKRRWTTRPLDDHMAEIETPRHAGGDGLVVGAKRELLKMLRRAIAEQLTPKQRRVLLSELQGVPQVVLADRLSVTPGAIYKTSHDARKKLKTVLTQAGFDAGTVLELLAKT